MTSAIPDVFRFKEESHKQTQKINKMGRKNPDTDTN